jgi:hypothetical protein
MLPTSSLSRQTKRYRPRNATTQEAQELHTYCVKVTITGIPLAHYLYSWSTVMSLSLVSHAYLLKAQLCVSHDTVLQRHGHPPLYTTHDFPSPIRYMLLHSIQGFHPYLSTGVRIAASLRFASVSRAGLDDRPLLASGRVTLVELQRVRAPPPRCSTRDYLIRTLRLSVS